MRRREGEQMYEKQGVGGIYVYSERENKMERKGMHLSASERVCESLI